MRTLPTTGLSSMPRMRGAARDELAPTLASMARVPALAAVPVALIWSYWSTIQGLIREWSHDPNYSVGQLVPFAALYLVWQDRGHLRQSTVSPTWWGVGIMCGAQALRTYGLVFLFDSAERYSLVLTVAGLVLFLFGWSVFRRTGWILLFLTLMVPLPGRIHNWISGPLQSVATGGAVFLLELLGILVTREGHVIVLNGKVPIAVAEACSGLRMLTAFVVVGCVLAYVVSRPRMQKAFLILSTVPVAILCNLLRLVVTAVLFLTVSGEFAERFFHDFAGWTMMPMAVLMLAIELWLFSYLVISDGEGSGKSETRQIRGAR